MVKNLEVRQKNEKLENGTGKEGIVANMIRKFQVTGPTCPGTDNHESTSRKRQNSKLGENYFDTTPLVQKIGLLGPKQDFRQKIDVLGKTKQEEKLGTKKIPRELNHFIQTGQDRSEVTEDGGLRKPEVLRRI